jgi:hypothetical protein
LVAILSATVVRYSCPACGGCVKRLVVALTFPRGRSPPNYFDLKK